MHTSSHKTHQNLNKWDYLAYSYRITKTKTPSKLHYKCTYTQTRLNKLILDACKNIMRIYLTSLGLIDYVVSDRNCKAPYGFPTMLFPQ